MPGILTQRPVRNANANGNGSVGQADQNDGVIDKPIVYQLPTQYCYSGADVTVGSSYGRANGTAGTGSGDDCVSCDATSASASQ